MELSSIKLEVIRKSDLEPGDIVLVKGPIELVNGQVLKNCQQNAQQANYFNGAQLALASTSAGMAQSQNETGSTS